MSLLIKGPNTTLHTKQQNWLQNLALEDETAISKLPTSNRDIQKTGTWMHQHPTTKQQPPTHPQCTPWSQDNQDYTVQAQEQQWADKGNSLIILPTQQYESKVHNFLQVKQFQTISTDPTKTYQA
jgi:hypothetical protein